MELHMAKYARIFIILILIDLFNLTLYSIDTGDYKKDMAQIQELMNKSMYKDIARIWEKWALNFENEKMFKESSISYSASAKAYEKIYNINKAILNYKKGISLLNQEKNLDKKYSDLIYRWNVNIALLESYYAVNLKEADELLIQFENYFKENKMDNDLAYVYKGQAFVRNSENNFQEALALYKKAMDIFVNSNKEEYLKVINEILNIYYSNEISDIDIAKITAFEKDILSSNSNSTVAKYFLTKAKITKDISEKSKIFDQCLGRLKKAEDASTRIKVLLQYSELFLYQDPKKAIAILKDSEQILKIRMIIMIYLLFIITSALLITT